MESAKLALAAAMALVSRFEWRFDMRIVIAAVLALGLTGCADSDFVEHPITSLIPSWGDDAQPAQPAPADMQATQNAEAAPGTAAQPATTPQPASVAAAQSQP